VNLAIKLLYHAADRGHVEVHVHGAVHHLLKSFLVHFCAYLTVSVVLVYAFALGDDLLAGGTYQDILNDCGQFFQLLFGLRLRPFCVHSPQSVLKDLVKQMYCSELEHDGYTSEHVE